MLTKGAFAFSTSRKVPILSTKCYSLRINDRYSIPHTYQVNTHNIGKQQFCTTKQDEPETKVERSSDLNNLRSLFKKEKTKIEGEEYKPKQTFSNTQKAKSDDIKEEKKEERREKSFNEDKFDKTERKRQYREEKEDSRNWRERNPEKNNKEENFEDIERKPYAPDMGNEYTEKAKKSLSKKRNMKGSPRDEEQPRGGDSKNYSGERRRSDFGGRRTYDDRREYGDRRDRFDRRDNNDRREFDEGRNRREFNDRREYGDRRDRFDRRDFNDRREFDEGRNRRDYNDRRDRFDRRDFDNRRDRPLKGNGAPRREFDNPRYMNKEFTEQRSDFGDGRRGYNDRREFGDRRDRFDRRDFNDRREYGDRRDRFDRRGSNRDGNRNFSGDERREFRDRQDYSNDRREFGNRRDRDNDRPREGKTFYNRIEFEDESKGEQRIAKEARKAEKPTEKIINESQKDSFENEEGYNDFEESTSSKTSTSLEDKVVDQKDNKFDSSALDIDRIVEEFLIEKKTKQYSSTPISNNKGDDDKEEAEFTKRVQDAMNKESYKKESKINKNNTNTTEKKKFEKKKREEKEKDEEKENDKKSRKERPDDEVEEMIENIDKATRVYISGEFEKAKELYTALGLNNALKVEYGLLFIQNSAKPTNSDTQNIEEDHFEDIDDIEDIEGLDKDEGQDDSFTFTSEIDTGVSEPLEEQLVANADENQEDNEIYDDDDNLDDDIIRDNDEQFWVGFHLIKHAAVDGDKQAQCILGCLLFEDEDVVDKSEAIQWLTSSDTPEARYYLKKYSRRKT